MSIDFTPTDYINTGDYDVGGSAMSIMAWVRAAAIGTDPRIFGKGTGIFNPDHWWMLMWNGTGTPAFRLFTTDFTALSGPSALSTGVTYHIAATYDGATMRLYVDGLEVANTAKTGAIKTGAAEAWIAAQAGAAGQRDWQGRIGDVRLYNVALGPNQIEAIHGSRGLDDIRRGLIGRWPLRELASGLVVPSGAGDVRDVSDFKRNGTQVGDPVYADALARVARGAI